MQLIDEANAIDMEALLPLPAQVGRFVRLPGKDIRFIAIEQVIIEHVDQLFPNFSVTGNGYSVFCGTVKWKLMKRLKTSSGRSCRR